MTSSGRRSATVLRFRVAHSATRLLPAYTMDRLRTVLLRLGGVRIGPGSLMWSSPTLVGDLSRLDDLVIGHDCAFNVGCSFELGAPISIGDHVALGHDVRIVTSDPGVSPGAADHRPVTIGDGAWIAARCTLMPGVTIGAGSVISAASVVADDVEPNTLLSGRQRVSLARWR